MDRFDAMKAFVTVATEGSFTKAADKLDTSNQLVSKYVAKLEGHIGARLFNRTTRRIHLTEAGEQCLQHAKHILESLDDMEGSIGELRHRSGESSPMRTVEAIHFVPSLACKLRLCRREIRIGPSVPQPFPRVIPGRRGVHERSPQALSIWDHVRWA